MTVRMEVFHVIIILYSGLSWQQYEPEMFWRLKGFFPFSAWLKWLFALSGISVQVPGIPTLEVLLNFQMSSLK